MKFLSIYILFKLIYYIILPMLYIVKFFRKIILFFFIYVDIQLYQIITTLILIAYSNAKNIKNAYPQIKYLC